MINDILVQTPPQMPPSLTNNPLKNLHSVPEKQQHNTHTNTIALNLYNLINPFHPNRLHKLANTFKTSMTYKTNTMTTHTPATNTHHTSDEGTPVQPDLEREK